MIGRILAVNERIGWALCGFNVAEAIHNRSAWSAGAALSWPIIVAGTRLVERRMRRRVAATERAWRDAHRELAALIEGRKHDA